MGRGRVSTPWEISYFCFGYLDIVKTLSLYPRYNNVADYMYVMREYILLSNPGVALMSSALMISAWAIIFSTIY